jgi:ABC-2 type transport system permease protein
MKTHQPDTHDPNVALLSRRRHAVVLVAAREVRQRTRSRAFAISTVIMILAAVGAVILSTVLPKRDTPRTVNIGMVTAAGDVASADAQGALATAIQAIAGPAALKANVRTFATTDEAKAAVRSGGVDVAVAADALVWHRRTDAFTETMLTSAIRSVRIQERAANKGIDESTLSFVLSPMPIGNLILEPEPSDKAIRVATASVGVVFLFMTVQIYGSLLLNGVIEEKSSRVVEVLLGHVRARQLLAGKTLGIGLVGLLQVFVVSITALVTMWSVRHADVPKVPVAGVVWLSIWFLLGFGLNATLFTMAGSLVSRQEDASSVTVPVMIPFLVSYFASLQAVRSPGSTFSTVASLFPMSAPLVMPMRIAASAPPVWQIALSIALVVVTTAGIMRLAGRLYERNLLHTGTRLTWRAALRRAAA